MKTPKNNTSTPATRALHAIGSLFTSSRGGRRSSLAPRHQRSFTASTSNRLLDWILSGTTVTGQMKVDYRSLTLRARDLALNNEFCIGYLASLKRNVLGVEGFTLQSFSSHKKRIKQEWNNYTSAVNGYITLDEIGGGRDFDHLILRTLTIDGEVFIRKLEDPRSPYLYRYELLDSMDIDPTYNESRADGSAVIMGIELDQRGRETGYYYRRRDPMVDSYGSGTLEYLPAGEVLHIFRRLFPNQIRGYSAFSGIVLNIKNLDEYKQAEIVHARIQACSMGIWERDGSAIGDVMEQDTGPDGEIATTMAPGMFMYAPKGYKAAYLQASSPNGQFGIFWKSIMRSICSALGISYNKAAGDYEGVNYSSLREAAIEDRAEFEELQKFIIERWKDLQYRGFLEAILPGIWMTNLAHRFYGRRFDWVDPQKDSAELQAKLDMKLTDPITELYRRGLDPEEVLSNWAEWESLLRKFQPKPEQPPEITGENNAGT